MKRTPPTTKTSKAPKTAPPAKPPAKSAAKPTAAAKKAPAKKPTASKSPPSPQPAPPATKQSQLIALLESTSGATLDQMMELTGWLPHTVRGMLSGSLRKRLGLNIQQRAEEGVRVYRIVKGATP